MQGPDSPAEWRIILSTLLILSFGSLAAGAGVGGGGLFVPIYGMIMWDFDAIVISFSFPP
jgi:uncharacterized membrane protein YfcA